MVYIHNKEGEKVDPSVASGASVSSHTAVGADVEPAISASGSLRLAGYSASSITNVASFRLIHGETVSGNPIITQVELPVDGSDGRWFGDCGIACPDGVSIDRIVGTPNIFLYYKHV